MRLEFKAYRHTKSGVKEIKGIPITGLGGL
jgi:hypothetical protein